MCSRKARSRWSRRIRGWSRFTWEGRRHEGRKMLTIENLNQYYGGSHILRDVSFDLPPGKVTVLLGRNGVGKTTLLRTLMGLVPARTGSVRLEDRDITRARPDERVRAGIGYVPQGREIFPRLSVEENLVMGLATRPRGA